MRTTHENSTDLTFGLLRPNEQRLITLLRDVRYGTVSNICIHAGELVMTAPRTRRKIRLGKADAGRLTQPIAADFKLKSQHCDLIERIRRVRKGLIASIEVQDGLPVDLVIEEDAVV